MKAVFGNAVRGFLCAGLLLGRGAVVAAQEPTTQNSSASVDDIKANQRDRDTNDPNADLKKDHRSDLEITQEIRQALIKEKSFSRFARNVEIITRNGQVTLKGPVRTSDEKRTIEATASGVAGESRVTSELNIQP